MLNSRIRTILRELMISDIPITGAYLANLTVVTTRTTREDIKKLDASLADYGARIVSKMGKGYQLEISDQQKFHKYMQAYFDEEVAYDGDVPKTPEERIAYIIKRLLLSDVYLKLDDLADEIYVSKSTIQNDLKHVKQIFDEYDIALSSRPNHGLQVKGSELKLRFCMAEYLFDRQDTNRDPDFYQQAAPLPKEKMEIIQAIIMQQINDNHITLSDIAINNLLIHIAIAYKRIKSGNHVSLYPSETKEIMEQKEYKVAANIVEQVEQAFQIAFPQAEVAYIAIHLLGTKMLSQTSTGEKVVEQVIDDDILNLVRKTLDKIEAELSLDLKHDKELLIGLSLHLKPAINRYKYGMNIRNPMLQDIKRNYPLAFEAGVIAGLVVEAYTGVEINESEVGYLALHFGAAIERKKIDTGPKRCLIVCASGFGTARLILYKLKNHFGKSLEVIDSTEYYKLHQCDLRGIDFIVSSIPITDQLPIPVIEVNAILGEHDLAKIEKFVLDKKQPLHAYFKPDLLFLGQRFTSKEEVLTFLDTTLRKKKLVGSGFLQSVYERESVAPTSFGNLVAIPHPLTPKSKQTFLAVCTLEKPIMWSDKPVQFVCLLCVKKNSQEDLQAMYEVFGKIIDDRSIVHKLVKAQSYDQFMNVLLAI